ncbi:MAG: LysM peptidoglycan-binding domain-containing protein [Phenylobacterium sp.]
MTHFLQRTALILVATSALSACATASDDALRPNYPINREAAAPPAAAPAPTPVPDDAPVQARPAAPVESRPLDSLPPARQPDARPAPASEPAAPTYRTVTKRSVTGRVIDVDGKARTYEVQKGDTLAAIARKLDTTVDQLKDDNGLKGSTIQPGQDLKGPKAAAKAYVAGSGDTLFAIGRRFGVSAEALRAENGLSRNASIRSGQRLRLPSGFKDKGPIVTTSREQVGGGVATPEPEREEAPPPRATTRTPTPAATTPAYRTVTTRSVTGRVVDADGKAVTYTVKSGDNLEKIARKLDTTVDQLKDDNNLRKSTIQPGQKLKGPKSSAKAYVAGSGDTLATIGRRFGVSAEALRAENGLSRNASIRSGQRLRLPDGYRDRGPLSTTTRVAIDASPAEEAPAPAPVRREPTPAPVTPRPQPVAEPPPVLPSSPQPYRPSGRTPAQPRYIPPTGTSAPPPAAPTSAAPLSDSQISSLGRGVFIWPVRGDVVSDFGPKGAGQRNDGLNIRVNAGDTVRAAAAGDVVYAGDQVPGFGNLVLIKHADGWVTAYGHLNRVEVKMQQKVTQGQQIGQAGSTGGVSEPQLHFEVRFAPSPLERARPIDPKLVLPR